ncbi:unnamed protein product, partial [Brassica oleracea var. botrytis]
MEGNNSRNEPDAGLPSFQPSVRRKDDTAWRYITERTELNGKRTLICDFCQKESGGGGINRMKQHLAGIRGNIGICTKVSADVQFQMKQSLKENEDKSKEKRGIPLDDIKIIADMYADGQGIHSHPSITQNKKRNMSLSDPTQPSIKEFIQSKEKVHDADLVVALWFYDACIPMNTVNTPFFQVMLRKAASLGHGYTERYPNLAWPPCAAHCMNLILEDVGNMPNVQDLVSAVSK